MLKVITSLEQIPKNAMRMNAPTGRIGGLVLMLIALRRDCHAAAQRRGLPEHGGRWMTQAPDDLAAMLIRAIEQQRDQINTSRLARGQSGRIVALFDVNGSMRRIEMQVFVQGEDAA